MKLFPLNKDIPILEECGYGEVLDFKNDSFHGHQKGVAICVINKESGAVEQNMLRENLKNREELLKMILESKKIIKIVNDITQLEGDKLIPKQVFYLPYMVADHSVFKETVNWDNVSGASNVTYELDVEILFVHENLNRYITTHITTKNVSIMDAVYGMFEIDDLLQTEFPLHGFRYQEEPDKEGMQGWIVDFYDEAGNRYEYGFENGERLRDTIASVRLIGIEMEIDNDSEEHV